jgi:trypsin
VATQVTVSAEDSLDLLVKKAHTTVQTQQSTIHHLPAESRIVGGTDAAANAYPSFVVSLSRSLCGGTLIWEDLVLTAAHCAGAWDDDVIVSPNSGSAGQIRSTNTQLQRVHPSYTSSTIIGFDFMVVKLNNPVTNPVLTTLNEEFNDPATGDNLKVIGYGRLSEDGGLPNRLQEVTVKKIAFTTCNQQYRDSIIDSIMFCAGVNGGGKDSCQGDSGGPLFNPAGEQVGLVSFGIGCGEADFPGVYSRVSGAYDWINDRICELADNKPCTCDDTCGPTGTDYSQSSTSRPNEVVFRVQHDNYPTETAWTLTDSSGALIVGQEERSYTTVSGTVLQTVYLAAGDYTFRMTDRFGDGICCSEGNGEFQISVNGSTVVTGGQFNNAVTETVVVPGGGGSALREFFVDITYDNFPTETSWAIVLPLATTSDITIIVGFGTSSGGEPGGSYTVSADLVPGETYDLVLLDSVGDGICCQFREGSIEVYEAVNGQKITLTSSDGAFGTSQILTFSVPATRTAVKTRTPECHDSVDEDFHVDDTTGSRGCAWLASNMDRFDYLCEFVDISSICPITCGSCNLFA